MQKSNNISIIRRWVGKDLPVEHIYIKDKPKELDKLISLLMRRWLVHPLKRKVARFYLIILRNIFGLKVIGITGSAGKTSTKEMVLSILSKKGSTKASIQNVDPIYNIPQTILRCTPLTNFVVLEMGVEYVGEMDFYLWMAKPDISVITNIFPTHTKYFGDVQGVFDEKIKILGKLRKEEFAVLNFESEWLKKVKKYTKARLVYYGKGSNYSANNIKHGDKGTIFTLVSRKRKINVQIPTFGAQFVSNSLAAVAVADLLTISLKDVKRGLESYTRQDHRMNSFYSKKGMYVLDDSYNNNPEAAMASLNTFIKISGDRKKIVIFGDMLELGKLEERYHKMLGKMISELGIDRLVGVGYASKTLIKEAIRKMEGNKCYWVNDYKGVYNVIKDMNNENTAVLIKGSRSIGLEKVVKRLK